MSLITSFQQQIRQLLKAKYTRWLRHVLFWVALSLFLRYALTEPLYKDTQRVEDWVAAGQIVQSMALYYFFGYYVFPRYLFRLNIPGTLAWLAVWHIFYYIVNYWFFWYLQQINVSNRIERDWQIFKNAGLWGFINSVGAASFSFFYSFPFALILLSMLAVKEVLTYRTRNLQLERDKLTLELDFLKAQVNPHFLFNTLNSVYARVFETDEQAADLVLRLSELMRYSLYEANVAQIRLDKELAYIQNYLDLERNRLADQHVSIQHQQVGPTDAYQIAPLLLIAFGENAFKHGLKGAHAAAYVQVRAEVNAPQLVFTVQNSVPPKRSAPVSAAKSGGIGLPNVRRRLDTLYPDRYSLQVTPAEHTYTVVLTIQLDPVS